MIFQTRLTYPVLVLMSFYIGNPRWPLIHDKLRLQKHNQPQVSINMSYKLDFDVGLDGYDDLQSNTYSFLTVEVEHIGQGNGLKSTFSNHILLLHETG